MDTRVKKARAEYHAKTGAGLTGFSTSGPPWDRTLGVNPEINLELRDMTVREILNALILHSAKIYRDRLNGFPISWKYEFLVDPDAPTGLGGYPAWGQIGESIPQEIFR